MVYRNNAGRLGAGFISVCSETSWLGQQRGFYVQERPCITLESKTLLSRKEVKMKRRKTGKNGKKESLRRRLSKT